MYSIRRLTLGAALFLCCGAAVFLLSRWISNSVVTARARTVIQGKPFTMLQITVGRGMDGTVKVTEQRTIAVNREGAEAWLSTFPHHPESGPIRRLVRSDGRATIAFEKFALKMSQYIPTRILAARNSFADDAGKECRFSYESDLGRTVISGVTVSVSQYQPAANRRETAWRALEYACTPMAFRIEELKDGRWELFAESTTAWFQPGDPAEELFDETWFGKLQESSPAEALRRIAAATGIDAVQCPACYNPAALEELEKQYYKHQTPQP